MPDGSTPLQQLARFVQAEVRRQAVRDSLITLGGNVARLAMGVLVARVLARGLGPERLGAFYVVSSVVLILGTVGDGGLSPTAVREIARLRSSDRDQVPGTAGAFLVLKLAFAAACGLPVLLLAGPLGVNGLHLADGDLLLRIAVLTLITTALSGWASFVVQGLRRFGWVAVSQIGTAAAGLAAFGTLWQAGRLTVPNGVLVGALTPLAGFALLLPALRAQPVAFRDVRARGAALLRFSRWMWVSAVLSIVAGQLDLLLVNRWSAPALVGFYGLAGRLAQAADLVGQSNFVALLPAVSAQQTVAQHRAFMRASLKRTVPLAGLLLAGALLAAPLVPWYFGANYAAAVPLFWILMLSVTFDLITTPLLLVAFPLNLPRVLAASDAVRVAVLALSAALLVPVLGPAGAAWARLAAKAAGAAFTLALIARRIA